MLLIMDQEPETLLSFIKTEPTVIEDNSDLRRSTRLKGASDSNGDRAVQDKFNNHQQSLQKSSCGSKNLKPKSCNPTLLPKTIRRKNQMIRIKNEISAEQVSLSELPVVSEETICPSSQEPLQQKVIRSKRKRKAVEVYQDQTSSVSRSTRKNKKICSRKLTGKLPDKNSKADCDKQLPVCLSRRKRLTKYKPKTLKNNYEFDFTISVAEIESHMKRLEYGFRSDLDGNSSENRKLYLCNRIEHLRCGRTAEVVSSIDESKVTVSLRGKHTCHVAQIHNSSQETTQNIEKEDGVSQTRDSKIDKTERNKPLSALEKGLDCEDEHSQYQILGIIRLDQISSQIKTIEYGFIRRGQLKVPRGTISYYNCQRIKWGVWPQCGRRLKILIPTDERPNMATVSIRGEHTCITAPLEDLNPKMWQMLHASSRSEIDSSNCARDGRNKTKSTSNTENSPDAADSSKDAYETLITIPIDQVKSHVLTIEYGFRYMTKREYTKGTVRYYTCRRLKFRARPQCERKLQVSILKNSAEMATIAVRGKHTCYAASLENLGREVIKDFHPPKDTDPPKCQAEAVRRDKENGQKAPPDDAPKHPSVPLADNVDIFGSVPIDQLDSYVRSVEYGFIFRFKHKVMTGSNWYYNCRRLKCNAKPQCERKMKVYIPKKGNNACITIRGKHTCTSAPFSDFRRETLLQLYGSDKTAPVTGKPEVTIPVGESSDSAETLQYHSSVPRDQIDSHALSIEFGFRCKQKLKGSKGTLAYYNCQRIKVCRPQCDRRLHVFIPANVDENAIVRIRGRHTCQNAPLDHLTMETLRKSLKSV